MYEFLDHTADVAVRLRSADAASLFEAAASAHVAIVLDLSTSAPLGAFTARQLSLRAEDGEALLIEFYSELIYRFDTERFLTSRVDVHEVSLGKPASLLATLLGETLDPTRHVARTEIKAATFHGLEIQQTPAGLEAVVVFDL